MKLITEITSAPAQNFVLIGENNERINFNIRYLPTQIGWVCDIEYEDFIVRGVRITAMSNILRQWNNVIPFGILCNVKNGTEPFFIDDFSEGRAEIYLLTETEVAEIESAILS